MPSQKRDLPILTEEDAKRFIEREKEVNEKRKEYAQQKIDHFQKLISNQNDIPKN